MAMFDKEAFDWALANCPELETLSGVENLKPAFTDAHAEIQNAEAEHRDLSQLGSIASIAGLILAAISLSLQIRAGLTSQGATREQLKERLIVHISSRDQLSGAACERLANKLIDSVIEPNE